MNLIIQRGIGKLISISIANTVIVSYEGWHNAVVLTLYRYSLIEFILTPKLVLIGQ